MIVGSIGVFLVIGLAVAAVFLTRAVDDRGLPGLLGGECVQFQAAYVTMNFTTFLATGADDAQRQKFEQDMAELDGLAPSEIRDDLTVVAEAFREAMRIATGGQGLAAGADASDEQNRRAEAVLEEPEVVAAQANINQWVEDNCS